MASQFRSTVFKPQDLITVGHVHDDVCEQRGINPSSPEAEQIALTIITFFQSGIRDEASLAKAMGLKKMAISGLRRQ